MNIKPRSLDLYLLILGLVHSLARTRHKYIYYTCIHSIYVEYPDLPMMILIRINQLV